MSRGLGDVYKRQLYESTGVELSTPAFLQNWRRKAIFGVIMTIWGMMPYMSYPVWIVFFWTIESTRGISQAINRRTGHDSECSI